MLAEPSCCSSFRERKLVEIGIEMATRYQGEPFGLQRTLISCKRQIGDSQLVVARDNQQQRCWRNARNPEPGFVHARGPRRAQGNFVFPEACRNRPKIKIDSVLGAVGGRNRGIATNNCLSTRRLSAQLSSLILVESVLQRGRGVRGNQ